jgi:glycosyltransferase involved in cell wall biosynthesis
MLRVGFDDQIFVAQKRGGVSRYLVELITRLPNWGIQPVLLSNGTRNVHLASSGLVPPLPVQSAWRERVDWVTWRLIGKPRTSPRHLPQIDIMHHSFTHPVYLHKWRGPRVVTMHDMTPELFPELFKLGNPHFAKREYCERADAIIAVSENTAADMFRMYSPNLERKTTVIPLGVGENFLVQSARATLPLPDRYMLFVGVRTGYKDFATLFRAYQRLADSDVTLNLVVVGGGDFTRDERSHIAASGKGDRVHHLSPTDAEMPEIYRRAAVFVFPSRYEGFGLPTLESLASGTPTVLADSSCMREVGGEVALYFEPSNADDLAARVREAMDPKNADRVAVNGPSLAATYNWDVVANRTSQVYQSVVNGRHDDAS